MKEIKMIESKKPVRVTEIKKFANSIDITLPEDYISFLLQHNGGHPIQDSVDLIEPIDEVEKSIEVGRFLALYDGYNSNLQKDYEVFKNRIPKKFLPFAHNSCGDLICLCLEAKNYGKVYFWDHNWEADNGEKVGYDNIFLVADSFADFINGLYRFDIEEDNNGEDIDISIHDKSSLPVSSYTRKHGKAITDFFDKVSKEVKKFIIKEFTANGDLLLSFNSDGKEYFRRLNKDGKIIEEYYNYKLHD